MNINLARTFIEVLNARNFSKAAERLCITQAAVTVRINSLESSLGQQLFTRTKTGVDLTVAGRKFQPYAESLVQTWQQARNELALPADISALCAIGFDPALWVNFCDSWVSDLRAKLPDVALNVEIRHSSYLTQRVTQGLRHAVVIFEPQPHHGIVLEHLFDDRLVLVSREPREPVRWHPQYVFVEWTEEFRAQHSAIMPTDVTPPLVFADGVFALEHILRTGGSGYFPIRMALPHLKAQRLYIVPRTPIMTCGVHLAYTEQLGDARWFKGARDQLHAMASEHSAFNHRFAETAVLETFNGPTKVNATVNAA
jgi:DNA-binding transcriptional LysR family regulator